MRDLDILDCNVCSEVDLVLNSPRTRPPLKLLECQQDGEGSLVVVHVGEDHEGKAVHVPELGRHRPLSLRGAEEEPVQGLIPDRLSS